MVQGYYTLQEAAQVLGMPPEELKQMAQKNQIRSFQDRGTWRFRVQDIQELARQRGAASDMELVLGEPKSTPPRSSGKGAKSPARSPKPAAKPADVFDFSLGGDDSVGIGEEVLGERRSGRGGKPPDSKRGPITPSVPPGSDSDVRLVPDNSDLDFVFDGPNKVTTSLASDSNVKLVGPDSGRQKSPGKSKLATPSRPAPDSPVPRKPASNPPAAQQDSPVRLVPMDSDSDVKIVGAGSDEVPLGDMMSRAPTDSDIRLEPSFVQRSPGRSDEGMLTEEINLDEELKKAEAQRAQKPQAKVKPKSKLPKFPSASPFELSSDSELRLSPSKPAKPDSSDYDLTPAGLKPDSSDFDLKPGGVKSDSSDFDLSPAPAKDEGSSDDFSLELPGDSDFSLDLGGSIEGELKGPSSGISLGNPVDSGISLEQGGEGSDELEFELSVDAQSTPRPAKAQAKEAKPDSSEFELSLDDSGGPGLEPSSGDSSEFELTLDDSGSLPSLDVPAPGKSGEKDIFETDFEVPGLEEESGSQVAALETDLDSSDFDLAIDGSDVASDEESGSNVVAVDEDADEGAATISAKRHPAGADLQADDDLGFEQLAGDDAVAEVDQEEEEEELAPSRRELVAVPAKAAPWGVLPVIVMLPCVVVMFLVGMMGLELVQHMTGYKPPGFLTKAISELVGQKVK